MKLPISVILLTHNEEKNIADCLGSCEFAWEIIVVDDDSVDGTVEIARTVNGVKVFHRALNATLLLRKILQLRRQNVTGFSLSMQMNV